MPKSGRRSTDFGANASFQIPLSAHREDARLTGDGSPSHSTPADLIPRHRLDLESAHPNWPDKFFHIPADAQIVGVVVGTAHRQVATGPDSQTCDRNRSAPA